MKAPPALAALATLAALLASGCSTDYAGGDKEGFLAAGNAICRDSGAAVKPALEELTAGRLPTTPELRSFAGDVALPSLQERVGRLRRLDPPTEDRAEVDEIISAYQKGIDRISADPRQLAEADPFLEAYGKASAYGLTACAE
ncbi:hypothetical protein BH20ACT17_BH20ACT17_04850 [soil metagenome]